MSKLDMSDSNSILRNILIILIVVGVAYLIYYLYNNNGDMKSNNQVASENNNRPIEQYKQEMNELEENKINSLSNGIQGTPTGMRNPVMNKINTLPKGPIVGEDNVEHFSQDPNYKNDRNATSFPKEQLTAEELLPQDNSSLWAQVNPSGVGSLKDRSFLQAGYNIGINTVGQTLRNANLQLRSEPPCPQVKVSPWLQSTIDPDVSRKPFEISGCA
jgi:hypothetical protein